MEYKIFVSASAKEQIKIQLSKRNTPNSYIRLGVKGAGCSGLSYSLSYEDEPPNNKDIIYDIDNFVKIIIDKKSIIYLQDSTLDWESSLIKRGFKINNPNEESSCGCGNSFSIKQK